MGAIFKNWCWTMNQLGALRFVLSPWLQESRKPHCGRYTQWLVMMDPSDHAHLRTVVNKSFTPCIVNGLAPGCEFVLDDSVRILEWHRTVFWRKDTSLRHPSPIGATLG